MDKSTETQGEAKVETQSLSALHAIARPQNWFLKLCVEQQDYIV